jgi:RNA polymerase sigma-70 factor (ECF subfamily)
MASFDVLLNEVLAAGHAAWSRESEAPASAGEISRTPGIMLDEPAFHRFYRQTAAGLRAYAARVLGNATHADDIAQESYLRLVRWPPATDDPHELRAVLFRIASRLIIDHWRRGRHERGRPDDSAAARGTPAVDIPLRVDMARVFEQLTPQQRQLMWLAYVEGADHREIATALGLRERSVRVLLHRTRRKLARLLREGGRGPGDQQTW